MNIKNLYDRIILRMIAYGAIFGGLASVISLSMSQIQYIDNIRGFLYFVSIFLLVGAFWGGTTGLFCGLAIAYTIKDSLSGQLSLRVYRIGSSILIVVITGLVLFPTSLSLAIMTMSGDVLVMLFLWVMVAVISSQVTITKYLRETDVRKRKAK